MTAEEDSLMSACVGLPHAHLKANFELLQNTDRVSPTILELYLDKEEPECKSLLKVSTGNQSAVPVSDQATAAVSVQVHSQSSFTPLEGGKEGCGHDLVIGRAGMMKLGLRIEARTHKLCKFKRMLRA